VLPAKQYDEQHIPGAINIPLKKLDKESVLDLDRTKPTIVYCYDYQ
jgi:rhodanese-related sulfurtransferase